MFDDEIDTAGTVTQAAKLLRGAGVLDILVCCVHGVFSDPAIERLKDSPITEIVTTDTVPCLPRRVWISLPFYRLPHCLLRQ